MKILMQQGAYYPWIGGAEIFMKRVCEYLVSKGYHVDVVTGLWRKPDILIENWNSKFQVINGVNVYRTRTLDIKYIKTLSCIPPISIKSYSLDKINDYDIIHSHIFPGMVCGAILKKINKRKKLIITVQGGDLADYKETTGAFGGVLKPIIAWSLKNADIVHAVSSYTANLAKLIGAKKVVVIPNGVDTNVFFRRKNCKLKEQMGFKDDDKIIVTASRLTPKNGIEYLIKAVAKIKDLNIKLLIIGDGEQRSKLECLIRNLKLDNVYLLGYVPHEKLPEYLSIADVFVRPSLNEGFGISFIEAMACRVPVIGSRVGGIIDIIEDGRSGLLVNPGDVDDLVEKIKLILNDDELAKRLANEGYNTVMRKFTWDVILKKMEDVYKSLVE